MAKIELETLGIKVDLSKPCVIGAFGIEPNCKMLLEGNCPSEPDDQGARECGLCPYSQNDHKRLARYLESGSGCFPVTHRPSVFGISSVGWTNDGRLVKLRHMSCGRVEFSVSNG